MKKNMLSVMMMCCLPWYAEAGSLKSFHHIDQAIKHGKRIRIVTDFSQCRDDQNKPSTSSAIGFYAPDAVLELKNRIMFSDAHFTVHDSNEGVEKENKGEEETQPVIQSVYEYIKYTITPKNEVKIEIRVVQAGTFTTNVKPTTFICSLGVASKVYSAN